MSKRGGPLRPKFGGSNPYEKLTVFQLAKRARRGDGGAVYEMDQREGRAKINQLSSPPIRTPNQPEQFSD
jgi:hypothetical protein